MALSFCYGTVGSGKTYDAICRIVKDMQAGHTVVTINMNLHLDRIKQILLERGMSPFDADDALGRHERLYTEGRFRDLQGTPDRRIKLYADEAHFWWPQNGHYKINIEDVLQVAMSRKKQLDLHLISQLNGQINREVAGLSSDNWIARPLKKEPFYSGLKIWSRIQQGMGLRGTPAAFWYVRMEDELGRTSSSRKDGTVDPDNKFIRFLDPLLASCYDTLEVVSSPVLDRLKDEYRFDYLKNILMGKVKPQSTCSVCYGTRIERRVNMFSFASGAVVNLPWRDELPYIEGFIEKVERECGECSGRGYVYREDHPDFEEAERMAATLDKGLRRSGREKKGASV